MTDPATQAPLHDALEILLAGLCAGSSPIAPQTSAGAEMVTAMVALGARATPLQTPKCLDGVGNGCLLELADAVTLAERETAFLVTGLVGTYDMTSIVSCPQLAPDDPELACLLAALRAMGVQTHVADAKPGCKMELRGAPSAHPWRHSAAGWRSLAIHAVLLAALNTPGVTRMTHVDCDVQFAVDRLRTMGADIRLDQAPDGIELAIAGQPILCPHEPIGTAS